MADPKATQDAEANARLTAGVEPGEGAGALDTIMEGTNPGEGAAPAVARSAEPDAPARPLPPARSKSDDLRNAIVAKFRGDRTTAMAEQRDDISDFTRSGMPPEFAEPNAPVINEPVEVEAPPLVADATEAAAPAKFKVKVRGEVRELTLEELTAHAQIALAADNYLDEAKSRLKSAEDLEREIRGRATRAGQEGNTPATPQRAQTNEPEPVTGGDSQHPENPYAKLIETIQFGDPEEAQSLLENTIERKATTVVSATLEKQRFEDEGARTSKVLKDFEDAHPDIAQDPMARAAIEAEVLNQQVEDIKALGVDPATLRPDGMPPTPGDIANAHRWYRTKGFKVSAPQDLLQKSTDKFLKWKGVAATNDKPADPVNKAQPRVDVTVDRTARRQAIPQQPNRTAAPAAQTQTPQPRNRASIVQDMAQKRALPRGRVVA